VIESQEKCLIYFPRKLAKRFRVATWQGSVLSRYEFGKNFIEVEIHSLLKFVLF
jgi:hypothetical protein